MSISRHFRRRSDAADRRPRPGAEAGFGYFGVLVLVAVIGVAAAAAVRLGSAIDRRDREQELLAIGAEFRSALRSYRLMTPTGQRGSPERLDDLLKDPRYPGVVRHLRRVYNDPLTGKAEWGTILGPDGGIRGIHSLAPGTPIKIAQFAGEESAFDGSTKYSEWIFAEVQAVSGGLVEGRKPSAR